jgi:hypothetical protein
MGGEHEGLAASFIPGSIDGHGRSARPHDLARCLMSVGIGRSTESDS